MACRVLDVARQPYYRWLASPVTPAQRCRAELADAIHAAHRDNPEFGYRLVADEVRAAGFPVCDRTAWRICSQNHWWSAFGKKRGRGRKRPGRPCETTS